MKSESSFTLNILVLLNFCFVPTIQDFLISPQVLPKSYNVKLQPFIDRDFFLGEITIFLQVPRRIGNITLNAKNLEISELILDNSNTTGFELVEENEILKIFYDDGQGIEPGEHFVFIKFKGFLTSDCQGFFKSTQEVNGKKITNLGTQFSASNARKVFPCLDYPEFRSKFTIRIIKPNETYTVLSNMEEINSFEIDDGIVVDFRTTPPISPYLICFVITQYKAINVTFQSRDGRNVPLRLFSHDKYLNQAGFLLNIAKNAMKFFEDYTNLTYPLNKLDFIEVLTEMGAEGMENMGLITLRYNSVFFDLSKSHSKIEHQTNAAQLIVHEISHMWFGDIVTHRWYNDLWLTEGFAEFMEIKALAQQFPDWNLPGYEATIRHEYAFYSDTRSNSSLVFFPETHEEVEIQYGDLTYSKGSSVVTMLEQIMTPEVFKMAVRSYLEKFYMKTATTSDFVEKMQEFVGDGNLWTFLETWLYQNSYPLVVVTTNETGYILRQKNSEFQTTESIFNHKWTIPITLESSANCSSSTSLKWLDKDAESLYIPRCEGEKWVKFNVAAQGFYRVLYQNEQYENLLNNFEEFDEVDQANLIYESYHMSRTMNVSNKIPFSFVGKLKRKCGVLPLAATKHIIRQVPEYLLQKKAEYFVDVFKKLYEETTWKVGKLDSFTKRTIRLHVVDLMCNLLKYEKCIDDVHELGKTGYLPIHPDLFGVYQKFMKRKL